MKIPYLAASEHALVVEVLVEPGVFVEIGHPLFAVESDKAIYDVLSVRAGTVSAVNVMVGDQVADGNGSLIEYDDQRGHEGEVPFNKVVASTGDFAPRAGHHLTPSQRRLARIEEGAVHETAETPSTSLSDRVITGFNLLPWPKVDFMKFGPVDPKPLSGIKKISGANLHRNWVMIPHVTNNDEADITELEALRVQLNKENEKAGVKFTMLTFVIKAVVAALKKFPTFNASLDGDNVVFKQYYHVGFAADTPNGLVVPVIRDADRKGLVDIAKEMTELSKLAREGKLKPDQMQGGCLSISSLGGIGGTHFTPIINAPEVAILGLSRSAMKPVWDGKQFVPRLTLPLSLSYDHRVIDGAEAARFNAYLGAILGDFRRVIL